MRPIIAVIKKRLRVKTMYKLSLIKLNKLKYKDREISIGITSVKGKRHTKDWFIFVAEGFIYISTFVKILDSIIVPGKNPRRIKIKQRKHRNEIIRLIRVYNCQTSRNKLERCLKMYNNECVRESENRKEGKV